MLKFSDSLWKQMAPLYQKILNHPFNVELANGSLDQKRFIFYLRQDAYYLVGFSRSLAFIAARAESSTIIGSFLNFAQGALTSERHLHAKFLGSLHECDHIEPTPSCMAYVQFLIATAATASLEEAIAAVLPCFWIYREVGHHIATQAKENNPYWPWIDTYSCQEFSEATDKAIAILDERARRCSTCSLIRMEKACLCSTLFEWHFWEDAYAMNLFKKYCC